MLTLDRQNEITGWTVEKTTYTSKVDQRLVEEVERDERELNQLLQQFAGARV